MLVTMRIELQRMQKRVTLGIAIRTSGTFFNWKAHMQIIGGVIAMVW